MATYNDRRTKRNVVNWSSNRNEKERLANRPHITNNANGVRYYSSIDADIYFGEQFIDEVISIQWQIQQNAMPIFGYNSYTFDDVALGSRYIQGQFVLNFTDDGYLIKVMNVMKKISRQSYGQDNPETSVFVDSDRRRRNLPLWDMGFDIIVGYGEKDNVYNQKIILDCCQITGYSQQLDFNGEPISEVYSFIARDIKSTVDTSNGEIADTNTSLDRPTQDTESSEDGTSIINAQIFGRSSGSYAVFQYTTNKSTSLDPNVKDNVITSAILQIPDIFNHTIELIVSVDDTLRFTFTSDQMKLIEEYCSKNNITRVNGVVACTILKSDGVTINKDLEVKIALIM